METKDILILIPEWASAIGTIAAVIVALFSHVIKGWFSKPKITVDYHIGENVI